MIRKISKTDEINKRLRKEDKITHFDKPEDILADQKFKEELVLLHRDFIRKNYFSEQSAGEVTLLETAPRGGFSFGRV